jgi:oligoendopeptidase F
MPATLIHEFGHFAAFYRNGERLLREPSPDLAEIDSQGLELLAVLRYDTIYGDLTDTARTVQLYLSLYTLLSGCAEDEFERFACGTEDLTLEALNAEYGRLIDAYGLTGLGAEARSWTQVPQTFRSPLYGIGYAAAMSAAMELYRIGLEDPDAAVDAYLSIVDRKEGAGFRETLTETGLSDPFGPDWEKRFAETLGAIFPR